MGARTTAIKMFNCFKNDPFFKDALHTLSWTEQSDGAIDRTTGAKSGTTTTYSADAFLLSPSKAERPVTEMFRDVEVGDIVVKCLVDDIVKKPPMNHAATFNSVNYLCKGVVTDPVNATYTILLRE